MPKETAVETVETPENIVEPLETIVSTVETVEPVHQSNYVKHSIFRPSVYQRQIVVNNGNDLVFETGLETPNAQQLLKQYGIRTSDNSMFPNNNQLPIYGDFSAFKEFGDRFNLYHSCIDQFNALPSDVRKEFDNDVVKFSEYVNSTEFDITKVMSKGYLEKVYKPKLEEVKFKSEYEQYLKNVAKKEMSVSNTKTNL